MNQKRACLNLQRMKKETLLAILPSYPDPTYIIDVASGEKIRIDSINSAAKPLDLKNGLYKNKYRPIEKSYPRKILLNNSNWSVRAFNPRTREVCVSFDDGFTLSYTVPTYF
jgi:hypothetical protein